MKTRRFITLLLSAALILSLAACAAPAGTSSSGGGSGGEVIFTVAIGSAYDTLNFFSTESSMFTTFSTCAMTRS